MNMLSQEIIDRIVSFLPGGPEAEQVPGERGPSKAPYATISNGFRRTIERDSFKQVRIASRLPVRLLCENFSSALPFPPLTTHKPVVLNGLQKLKPPSRIFSRDFKRLFQVLSKCRGLRGLHLCLNEVAHTPAPTKKEEFGAENKNNLKQYRYLRTRLNLANADELPRIHGISYLFFSSWQRIPAPAVQLELAARVDSLQVLDMRLEAFEVRYPGFLRENRRSLADSLNIRTWETSTISDARFDLSLDGGAVVQTRPMPCLTYPEGYDMLGASLRNWSQHLTNFRVLRVFDESLFWPHAQENTVSTPEWRRMEVYHAHLERHTPSGWWYFMPKGNAAYGTCPRDPAKDPIDQPPESYDLVGSEMDTDQGDSDMEDIPAAFVEEEERWNVYSGEAAEDADKRVRNVPNEETMQPLFEAWTKALAHMPSMRQAKICLRSK